MNGDERQTKHEALKQTLKDGGIKFVRILWCDSANVIRAKAAHIDYLDDYIKAEPSTAPWNLPMKRSFPLRVR
jgi:glutamine synthetase